MKIALINGSPKIKDSASGYALKALKALLEQDNNEIIECNFTKPQVNLKELEQLADCKILVFSFPLYVHGIPSHLLNCLIKLETYFASRKINDVIVYSLINCGFYESHHNELAIEMMKNWCAKAGFKLGQGVAIGAGGMLKLLKFVPLGRGPMTNLGKAFKNLSSNILNRTSGDTLFITPNFPRFLYKIIAETGWRKAIKANGLKKKDLFLRK